jgi:hypothetical protein
VRGASFERHHFIFEDLGVGVVQSRVYQPGILTVIAGEVVRALEERRAFGCTAEFEGRGPEHRRLHGILGQPRAVSRMDDGR